MKIREHYSVRIIDFVCDRDEKEIIHDMISDIIMDDKIARVVRSGPLVDGNKIMPGKFHYIVHIDSEAADAFIKSLKKMANTFE